MYSIATEPAPPFAPPPEVAWTETGTKYHREGDPASGRTFCGSQIMNTTGAERIGPEDDPCDRCFRVRP